jgi:hypothetical protein
VHNDAQPGPAKLPQPFQSKKADEPPSGALSSLFFQHDSVSTFGQMQALAPQNIPAEAGSQSYCRIAFDNECYIYKSKLGDERVI